jgi:tetratricopeptide (TPR) repeat protein
MRRRAGWAALALYAAVSGCASAPRPVTKIVNGRIIVTRPISPEAYERVARALLYEEEEHWEEAARELQRALPFDDEAAELRAHLGELFIKLGRLDDAAEQIQRSLQIAPTVEGHLGAAQLAEARRDPAAARAGLRAAVALALDDGDAEAVERTHLALADADLAALDARAALATVKALGRVSPDSVRARLSQAALAWALGQRAEAEAALEEVFEIDRGELDARLLRAALLVGSGRTDAGKAAFREAIERAEGATEVVEMYLRWLVARGDKAEAATEADRLVPDVIGEDTVEAAVRIERAAGRPERARAAADKALAKAVPAARVALLVAGAMVDAKDHAGAAARLLAVPREAPEAVEAYLRAAEALRESGRFAEAEKALDKATAATAPSGSAAAGAGAAKAAPKGIEKGQEKGAADAGAKTGGGENGGAAAARRPARDQTLELAVARAALDEKRGDAARAARTLDAALEQAPKNSRLLLIRAALEERRGEWKRALAFAERVLATDPRHIEALNFHGFVAADHSFELPLAMRRLEVAVALDPGAGGIVDSLGWAHLRAGDLGRATELLVEADRLEPGDPEILGHVAELHARRQDVPRAIATLREALKRDPPERLARELEARLAGLEARSEAKPAAGKPGPKPPAPDPKPGGAR